MKEQSNDTNNLKAVKMTEPEEDKIWGSIGYAAVKTLVMFIGEMDYNDLVFGHWLGYVIFVLFAFLLIIVLMNILNGLYQNIIPWKKTAKVSSKNSRFMI